METVDIYINGRWKVAEQRFPVLNPANQELLAQVSDASAEDAQQAIEAAQNALVLWRNQSPHRRAEVLKKWAKLILEKKEALAQLLTLEQGKPLHEALGEIEHSSNLMIWAAEDGRRVHGQSLPNHEENIRNFTVKQGVGVVAAITPWNFPAAAVLVKCASALAASCTVVLKPSDETPLLALELARISKEAGLPDGCLNVLPCKSPLAVGKVLTTDPRVKMISFTGSTVSGKKVFAAASQTMKRVSLELGGNAPFIVHKDADIDLAVSQAMGAKFYNAGQICVGANRFLVHNSVLDEFVNKLQENLKPLKVGNGLGDVDYGPLINQKAVDKVLDLLSKAKKEGAQIVTGGEAKDLFFQPTIIRDLNHQMAISREEVFGPVVCIYSFTDEEEALRLANSTPSGLAAYVFSSSQKTLWNFSEQLEFGMVGANTSNIFSLDLAFTGLKESGQGREGGLDCLEDFMVSKNISMGLQ